MISSYICSHHSNWDQFLQYFAYALHTALNESPDKTLAELCLGKKIVTPLQRLVMVPGAEAEYTCHDVDKLVKEAQVEIGKAQKWQDVYCNMCRKELEIKVGDFVLVEKLLLSSSRKKKVANFGSKFIGPFKVGEVVNNNMVIDVNRKRLMVNLYQVRVYKFRENERGLAII